MSETMKGVLAELKTFRKSDGQQIASEIIFKPYCDWWIDRAGDGYANTAYGNVEVAIKDFGLDAVTKATQGEVVEVELQAPEDFVKVSCHVDDRFEKATHSVCYPFDGVKEHLERKS